MIVVDLTVLAPFLLRTRTFASTVKVSDKDPLWIMPREWRLELVNELVGHVQQGYADIDVVHVRLRAAIMLIRASHELIEDIDILSLAIDAPLSALEAVCVLTARRLGTKLVTDKTRILTTCPDVAVSPENFGAN